MRIVRSGEWVRPRLVCCGFLLLALAAGSPARAQVTEEGASKLADDLALYLGRSAIVDGILKVAPAGESYQVTLDLQKAADRLKAAHADAELTVGPILFKAAPGEGGTWTVTADSFPSIALRQTKPTGVETMDIGVEGYAFSGVYDPKLAAFSSGTLKSSAMSFTSRSAEGDVVARYGETTGTMSAAPGGNGGVTGTYQQKSAGLTETFTFKGETPMTVRLATGEIAMDASIESGHGQAMLQIMSFFAQNPEKDKIVAGQDDLRARLKAALPLWESTSGRISARDVAVETPMGNFKLAEFGEAITMSGLKKDGSYNIRFQIKGFEAPPGILPAWSTGVLPRDLDIAASVSGFDLEAAAALIVDKFDLTKPEPWSKEDQARIMALFSQGSLKVTMPPGTLTSPSLTLVFEGEATVMPQPVVAKAKVTADGLDKALGDLQGSPDQDPSRQQAIMMLTMAKTLAKPDGDKAVWVIEAAQDGSIKVNGQMMQAPTQQ